MNRVIELSKLNEEGLVIEEGKEFEQSTFSAIYQKAILILKDIVREPKDEGGNAGKKSREEIDNIISFEGRRGTGKTSVMVSIQNALKNYKKNSFLKLGGSGEDPLFVVLDHIDASQLESKENILTMVLSSMFLKLRDYDRGGDYRSHNEYGNKELYQQFDKVYANVLTLSEPEDSQRGISPLRMLNELSSSQALKKSLERLVEQYLKYMLSSERGVDSKRKFLVITIDDLDMRFHGLNAEDDSPFEMVEMIHRYLMLPNVIILVTYNYEDLHLACEKHFCKIYPQVYWDTKNNTKNNIENKEKVKLLTVEYLNKIIPIYRRVHMPSMRKKDYTDGNELMICVTKQEIEKNLNVFRNYLCVSQESALLPVKKFALLLKAAAIGLYYDALGEKIHFSEPTSLRGLAQSYQFYKRIALLCHQDKGAEELCFKELLDDLYFRFAIEKLSDEELIAYNNYLDVSIERRSRDIVTDIVGLHDKGYSEITYIGSERSSYSYGELLFGLYQASSKGLRSKAFIWCVLESYTIILTRLYRRITNLTEESETKKAREQLLAIVGASISSSWSNRMVPKLQRVRLTDPREEMDQASEYRILLDLEHSSLVSAAAVKHSMSYVDLNFSLAPRVTESLLEEDFQMFEILGMLFTNVSYRGSNSKIENGFRVKYLGSHISLKQNRQYAELADSDKSEDKSKQEYDIKFIFSDACFNIMNFVVNLLSWDNYFQQFHDNVKDAYTRYFSDLKRISQNQELGSVLASVDAFMETHSLKKKYQDWYQKYKGFSMPIYSFDMMYNVLKRQGQNPEKLPAAVRPEEYWSYIMRAYQGIGQLLKDEEAFYFGDMETNTDKKEPPCTSCRAWYQGGAETKDNKEGNLFYQAYAECPFIQYVKQLEDNKKRKEKFDGRFRDMMMSIVAIEK